MTTHFAKITFGSGETFEFTSTDPRFVLELDGIPIVGLQHIEDGGGAIGVYDGPDHERFKTVEVVTVPDGKDVSAMSFDELLRASSLGSPEAWQIRQSISPEEREMIDDGVAEIVSRLHEQSVAKEGGYPEVDVQTDVESMKTWAPWSQEQAYRLNVFQARGSFHPFTCPNEHEQQSEVRLLASDDGWICPVVLCDYTQDWAWLSMLDPENWRTTQEMYGDPVALGCICVLSKPLDGSAGWSIKVWNNNCTVHPQLGGSPVDPEVQLALADRPQHMGGGAVMREVGVPKDEPMVTKSGKELTDADVEKMAEEDSAYVDEKAAKAEDLGVSDDDLTAAEFDELVEKGQEVEVEVKLRAPHSDAIKEEQEGLAAKDQEVRKEGE